MLFLEKVHQQVDGPGGHLGVLMLEGDFDDAGLFDRFGCQLLLEGGNRGLQGRHLGEGILHPGPG